MNRWQIRNNSLNKNKAKPFLSTLSRISSKAQIQGKVFISENASIGSSKLFADEDHLIHIGKDTTIKDCVLIRAKETKIQYHNSVLKNNKDIYIGNDVFISSDVSIHGPSLISDGTYIGNKVIIINSRIGEKCTIESNALIKNVDIPPNTFIPSKSIVDSTEKLNEIIHEYNNGNYSEFEFLSMKTSSNLLSRVS